MNCEDFYYILKHIMYVSGAAAFIEVCRMQMSEISSNAILIECSLDCELRRYVETFPRNSRWLYS